MFLVCEPIAWGLEHVPFNAALLKTIRIAFPDDPIYFYGEESHLGHVQKHIGIDFADSIIWKTIILPDRHLSYFSRFSSDFRIIRRLLNELNEDQKNHTLVVAGNSSLLWALKILINSIHKDKDVQVILHGTLASLSSRKSLRLNKRLWDLRTALKMFNHKRIQYIVLEESIRNAVLQKLPSLRRFLSVFDHPIPLDEEAKGNSVLKPPVRFGFLGLANENKGFLTYLKVASEISTKFPGLAEFHVVGRLDNQYRDMHIPEIASLHTKPSIERLSRDEYIQALRKIHFVCLFYEGRHYEFSPSGALLDGIAWEKPVIASQMPIFKSLEQKFGDIGYLCKKGEFTKTIGTLLKDMDVQRYNRQILNIRNVKRARTPEILARKYRDIVELSKCGRMVKAADSGLCKA